MNKSVMTVVFAMGLAVVGWVGWGFVGSSPLALAMTVVIGGVYVLGAYELMQFRAATASLASALADPTPGPLADMGEWLNRLAPSLRNPVRQRIEGERVVLPGPALTPYLVGLLVMLGMLGTFLGMVITFKGAVFALEASSNLESIRAALAAPIKGLGLSFGTSVAGVAASAALGLLSAMSRRQRLEAVRLLDARVPTVFRAFSSAHRRDEMLQALQAQAHAMPLIAERLNGLVEGLERRNEQLGEQLLAQQQGFHREAAAAYTQLASAVGTSLQDSLGASARQAGEAIRPVVEQAMATLAQEAQKSHERLREATDGQMQALSGHWEGTVRQVADTWTTALHGQAHTHSALVEKLDGALQTVTQAFDQRSSALVAALSESAVQSRTAQVVADQQRLEGWNQSMDGMARSLTAEWQRAGAEAVAQQRDVSKALQTTATQLAGTLQTAAQSFGQRSDALLTALQETVTQSHTAQRVADQERVQGWARSMEAMTTTLADELKCAGEHAAARHQSVCNALESTAAQVTEQLTGQVTRTLGGATALMEQSDALLRARLEAEAQWVQAQGQRMDDLTGVWRTELVALRDAEAVRGQAAVDRLDTLQAAVAQHLATLGSALEAPLTRLLQTASDVPQAAAEVITQLRHEMTRLSERDNLALAERTAMMEQVGSLLESVSNAAVQQRSAIDSLVASASQVLEQAGAQFAQSLGAQAGKVDEVAAHVAASAVELASLGESFSHGVGLFSASNEKLMESLQGIEGAICQSMSRSDEQLAYYVAQAREVIDLSISSQQGIVEDLRRLHGKSSAQEVAA
ncbi:MAG: DUF802 domain-containing protein [Acidovorax sp.]|uniref:DUF802 domain-containing protein n=1 Tax=Acidovorax sp. TaxID=1872122 RepID=UPI00391B54CA